MIRCLLIGGAALAWFSHPALALQEPEPCPGGDARIRCIAAGPTQVILLRARPGASLVIELPDGESVVAVPVSDNALMTNAIPKDGKAGVASVRFVSQEDSDTTVDGNLSISVPKGHRGSVVVKPFVALEPQPLFVMTERDGKQQRYSFELRADADSEKYYYSVRLRNIAAEQQARRKHAEELGRAREQRVARDRLVQAQAAPCSSIANVNNRYVAQGDPALAPSEVCDDGRSTYLHFPGVQRIPAVYSILPDGREALINVSTGDGGWITVGEHSYLLRLRDGGRVLCLINRGYNHIGTNTDTGTISPEVVRSPVGPSQ